MTDDLPDFAASESRMMRILDDIEDRFYLVDDRFRLTYVNRSAERSFGQPRDRLLGRSLRDLFPAVQGTPFELNLRRAIKDRRSTRFETQSPMTGHWVEVRACPGDEGLAVFCHDIRKPQGAPPRTREGGLTARHDLLELIANRLPVLISYIDDTEHYRFANAMYERWFGAGATLGRSVRDVLGEKAYAVVGPSVRRALEGEELKFETRVDYKGAGVRDVLVNYIPDERDGRVHGFIALVQDVTEFRRLQESLEEADRRKDEFLATLAHELRNPLAPIHNAAALLRRSRSEDPIVRTAQQMIERQVKHMVQLVDDLLDVSRITLGRITLRKQAVGLQAVIDSAVETARPLMEARGHTLSIAAPAAPMQVHGDPVRLAQILQNLLNNAAKYTPAGGRIAVEARADGNWVELTVRDNGLGIPAAMLPRIFDPFTQVEQSLEYSLGGLGIGLTLVKRLVELHDGTVSVHSEGPGHGSEFRVRLPLLQRDPATAVSAESLQQDKAAAGAHVRRVLVVDDNRDAALSLAALLEISGHSVRVAYDGVQALKEAEEFRPERVLLDLAMPGMDGYETCRRLRAAPWGVQVRIVALSGWGHEAARERAAKAGFDAYLLKPVHLPELDLLIV